MPSSADIQKYTQLLGLVNGMIPVAVNLGIDVYGWIKQIRAHAEASDMTEKEKAKVRAEAQASLDEWSRLNTQNRTHIDDWFSTHPPEPEKP